MAEQRVTSVASEVLHDGAASALVTSVSSEVLHAGAAAARVTSVAVEVLRSVDTIVSSRGYLLLAAL